MTAATIVVVGSLNMDLVLRMARAPAAGETISGHDFATLPGGKGANQAVAGARLGASVAMVGRVGDDANGAALRNGLLADGIDVGQVQVSAGVATGVAMIWVEENGQAHGEENGQGNGQGNGHGSGQESGQNRIVLAPGANGRMEVADVERAGPLIDAAQMLIVQLEVPMPVVEAAIARAHAADVTVLLNPAPAAPLPESLWAQIDILVVNESEAEALSAMAVTDAASAAVAGEALQRRGPARVLVTLGAQGVVAIDAHGSRHTAAQPVRAVDTTAAGDTFIGALAVALCEGRALADAVAFGQAASALCVTRVGAQASIPYRRELASE